MTSIPLESEPNAAASPTPVRWQFEIRQLVYATALIGAGIATFGWVGSLVSVEVLAVWIGLCCVSSSRLNRALLLVSTIFVGSGVLWWQFGDLLTPMAPVAKDSEYQTRHAQLERIGIALRAYGKEHGSFPPTTLPGSDGYPSHSWRAILLRQLGYADLADAYNLQVDDQTSKAIHSARPDAYVYNHWGCTCFFAVTANNQFSAKYGEGGEGPKRILVMHCAERAGHWTRPRDVVPELASATVARGSFGFAGNFFYEPTAWTEILLADGSVIDQPPVSLERAQRLVRDGYEPADIAYCREPRESIRWGNCIRLAIFVCLIFLPLPWVLAKA
jgi:hypothetical protein